jgi:Tfp pilus assembly protein PilN
MDLQQPDEDEVQSRYRIIYQVYHHPVTMSILSSFSSISQAAGIAIDIRQDGSYLINCCQVITDRKQLTIEKKITDLDNADALAGQLNPKIPVTLNISGKGVLIKQMDGVNEVQQDTGKIFPDLNTADFYIQQFLSGDQLFVAVVRKNVADHWIGVLEQSGYSILSLSLGPFPLSNVIDQLNIYEGDINLNGFRITRDGQMNWRDVAYSPDYISPFTLKIGSEPIGQQLILPYAAAFQLVLFSRLSPVQAIVERLDLRYSTVIGLKKLKATGALILGFFFILLLLNVIVLSWLNAENVLLDSKVSVSASSNSDMEALTAQIKAKEMLLDEIGWDGAFNKARLIDQLAALLPEEITLREMAINPVDNANNKDTRQLHFSDHRIRLSGNSQQVVAVNEWVARIKTLKWAKSAELESFDFDNDQQTGKFNIIIRY